MELKVGDKLLCKEDVYGKSENTYSSNIILNKNEEYTIERINGDFIMIICNRGIGVDINIASIDDIFFTLTEIRKMKLDKISNKKLDY